MPNRLAFNDAAYSLPSVLKAVTWMKKMHIVANVSFGSSVNDDVSNMSYDDHIEQAAIKFNLPHSIWLLHDWNQTCVAYVNCSINQLCPLQVLVSVY